MAKLSKVEQELLDAAGISQKKGEDRQKFLGRLRDVIAKVDEEKWDDLSPEAQGWYTAATKADEDEKPMPEIDDDQATETEADSEQEGETEEKDEPVSDKKVKKDSKEFKPKAKAEKVTKVEKPAAKKEAAKVEKPKKEAAENPKKAGKKGGGKIVAMKKVMLKNLKAKPADLAAKLDAAGIEVTTSTMNTVRSDFLSSIRVLQDAGLLTKDLIETD